jgi:hypothetical protein
MLHGVVGQSGGEKGASCWQAGAESGGGRGEGVDGVAAASVVTG